MSINPLTQTSVTAIAPQPAQKVEPKPQQVTKGALSESTQSSRKDSVTISKAAATLNAAKETTTREATATSAEETPEARNGDSQTSRLFTRPPATEELQKSSLDKSQETRGTSRISKMV
ncbi:MAG: hypothetical protein HGA96_00670 [Desulfobulbaceae bacterium]|nr:hypothetical protein [Desulfobulbaceae bacterium]